MDWEEKKGGSLDQLDEQDFVGQHCAHVDATNEGPEPLKFGGETLFINAAIVTRNMNPRNPPWVVDLDLPRPSETF